MSENSWRKWAHEELRRTGAGTTARLLAIVGTAGRDKIRPMTLPLWQAMREDLAGRLQADDVLVSGGAAWADHLAVWAYLQGLAQGLILYLPAPLADGASAFEGPARSSASAANFYHQNFSKILGQDSIEQIRAAIAQGAICRAYPAAVGYRGFFARNEQVAMTATDLLAYTFGDGNEPADGGTKDTWNKFGPERRHHVSLSGLLAPKHQQALHCAAPAPARLRATLAATPPPRPKY